MSSPESVALQSAGGESQDAPPRPDSTRPLAIAGIAALLSSTCCVLPLVLVLLGVSGSWMAQLRVLEPYSNVLTGLAVAAVLVAGWRIYGKRTPTPGQGAGPDGAVCADPAVCAPASAAAKWVFWTVVVLTLVPIVVQKTAHFFYE